MLRVGEREVRDGGECGGADCSCRMNLFVLEGKIEREDVNAELGNLLAV